MAIWIKENGSEIDINDDEANEDYAKSLGWEKKGASKTEKKKVKKED